MARIDKYDPKSGGSRHRLAFAVLTADVGDVIGVGLNASGRLVRGAGNTGIKGVICPTQPMAVGDVIDVMRSGELADFLTLADGTTATTAGTNYFAATADGAVSTTNTGVLIGYTTEKGVPGGDRLVVQVGNVGTGA